MGTIFILAKVCFLSSHAEFMIIFFLILMICSLLSLLVAAPRLQGKILVIDFLQQRNVPCDKLLLDMYWLSQTKPWLTLLWRELKSINNLQPEDVDNVLSRYKKDLWRQLQRITNYALLAISIFLASSIGIAVMNQ